MSVTISDNTARFLHQLLDLVRFNGADANMQRALVQQELENGLKEAMSKNGEQIKPTTIVNAISDHPTK